MSQFLVQQKHLFINPLVYFAERRIIKMVKYYLQNKDKDYRRYGKGILFSNGCALNEIATLIFDMCNGETPVEFIVNAIYDEYDCEKNTILDDVTECISYLLENELIIEVHE